MERAEAGIGEHGFLSDCHTAAITAPDGAIVWMCAPAFDGPAFLTDLLDTGRGGAWTVEVEGARVEERAYVGDTLVLETVWRGGGTEVAVRDLMALRRYDGGTGLYREGFLLRIVECRAGRAFVRSRLAARPDYARSAPSWEPVEGGLREASGLMLSGDPAPVLTEEGDPEFRMELAAGESAFLALDHLNGERTVDRSGADTLTAETIAAWQEWSDRTDYDGLGAAQVRRSAIVLRGLLHEETGGLIAAPTASLPEWPGGPRNWDYRYVWYRDAALVVLAFLRLGHLAEARRHGQFVLSMCSSRSEWIPPVQTLGLEDPPSEEELDHLSGYAGSRPVRIGNDARGQRQLDVYGHVLDATLAYQQVTGDLDRAEFDQLVPLVEATVRLWREPDEGMWEVRGERRHWTSSKVYAWACLDRAVRLARALGVEDEVPLDRWRAERDAVRAQILELGYDPDTGSFRQTYGSANTDGSLLCIPLLGFLPGNDPRVVGTLERVEAELGVGGFLVRRYDPARTDDGLGTPEGAFLLCSFDMVSALVLAGRRDEARRRYDELCARSGPLGLYAEEMTEDGTMLGNFPQSFTHLALIEAALNLDDASEVEALHAWAEHRIDDE
ncbi:glycoside hydrolase family 15 protein [Nocardiopsis algeriensis]|uniref:GH15 family glucan-1,4-alpha-glucosidase n=1 Tax=Nocardiopsis algeriensis TaxID=1478215 RepID=A0A841IU99_9ACTN|nr:glycoside hydrolase family 15 protein [Nocardiopsis algeriensis]MBB6121820.1 GH15 family glucan-1,4-alpha-glucosidase [Nocardiopsis algeriensis]